MGNSIPIEYANYSMNGFRRCKCWYSVHRYEPFSVKDLRNIVYNFTEILDLYSGCSIMEGMNISNLACLFNQSCLNVMTFILNMNNTIAIRVWVNSNV